MEDLHKCTIDPRCRTLEYVTLPLHKSKRFLIGDTAARFQMNAEDIYYEERDRERYSDSIREDIHAREITLQKVRSMRDKVEISKQHRKTIKFLANTTIR